MAKTYVPFLTLALVLMIKVQPVPAPVPRCSPFIIINKLAESSNLLSDSNPYFPVPPCEYGGWAEALEHGDLRSVFVFAEPHKIPLHNFYEFIWLLKTGGPRLLRILTGKEKFVNDPKILREGYRHHTPHVRTNQIGTYTHRNPIIIDDKKLYKNIVGGKIKMLLTQGPDKEINKHYTYQGGRRPGGKGHGHSSGYGAPAAGYGAPAPAYGYGAPAAGYGAPASGYGAPASGYGAPAVSSGYGAPAPSYGAPEVSSGYGAPASTGSGYSAPASTGSGYSAPASTGSGYSAPASTGGGYSASSGSSYSAPAQSSSYSAPAVSSGYSAPAQPAVSSGYSAPATSSQYTAPAAVSPSVVSSYDAPLSANYASTEILSDSNNAYNVNAADIETSYSSGNPFLRRKKNADLTEEELAEIDSLLNEDFGSKLAEDDSFQPSESWPAEIADAISAAKNAEGTVRNARQVEEISSKEEIDHATLLSNGEETFFSGIVPASERQQREVLAQEEDGSLATVARSGDGSADFVSGFVPGDNQNPYFAAQRRGLPPQARNAHVPRPRQQQKSFWQRMSDYFFGGRN